VNRRELHLRATREATRARADLGIGPAESLCPFDAALAMGLIVQFMALPSLEGMYDAESQSIVVGSQRPPGRRRFTCAHELGHHIFGHGTRLDQLESSDSEEEYLADSFAAAFLMPKTAIDAALSRRGWAQQTLTGEMIFTVSQDLGVGYATLVNHMALVLRYIPFRQKSVLEARKPLQLRNALASFPVHRDLFVVDEHWGARPVDVEVGDVLLVPSSTVTGASGLLQYTNSPRAHLIAQSPGQTKIELVTSRSIDVRISREDYTGRAKNRHLEQDDDEIDPDVEDGSVPESAS
jgi:IrrE N-terminal-like domain